jgi:hypothetical protein
MSTITVSRGTATFISVAIPAITGRIDKRRELLLPDDDKTSGIVNNQPIEAPTSKGLLCLAGVCAARSRSREFVRQRESYACTTISDPLNTERQAYRSMKGHLDG